MDVLRMDGGGHSGFNNTGCIADRFLLDLYAIRIHILVRVRELSTGGREKCGKAGKVRYGTVLYLI